MPVVIIAGSPSDKNYVEKIGNSLTELEIPWDYFYASAHKQPLEVLEILENHKNIDNLVYITIAGRSNALSGFVAANCDVPTIACPPFSDKLDMMVNIHSTLQMPSNVPVLTILDPLNCALAVKRLIR